MYVSGIARFYLNSLIFHPGKFVRIFWNFLRGKETSKMESFLQETKRKITMRRGGKSDSKSEEKSPQPAEVA